MTASKPRTYSQRASSVCRIGDGVRRHRRERIPHSHTGVYEYIGGEVIRLGQG